MAAESQGITFQTLNQACDELADTLTKERNVVSEAHIRETIESFVDALDLIPGGCGELERRAKLVESRCGPGSAYDTARAEVQSRFPGRSRKLTGGELASDMLRGSKESPVFLAELVHERQYIEQLLKSGKFKRSAKACRAFTAWHRACDAVKRQASPLEVDGCWYLLHLGAARDDDPSDRNKWPKEYILSDGNSIIRAAKSLVIWATGVALEKDDGKATDRRRRRKKADDDKRESEAERAARWKRDDKLAAEWDRARNSPSRIYKVEFAKDNGMGVPEF